MRGGGYPSGFRRIVDLPKAPAGPAPGVTSHEPKVYSDDCICDTGPNADGPQEDCPQHGRPYSYWVERSDELGERVRKAYARQPFLTPEEHEAIQMAGDLWGLLTKIVGDGETRGDDLTELVIPIHTIQRYVMAQAATRAYPGDYRPLGLVIEED